jgi:hypothetical protein
MSHPVDSKNTEVQAPVGAIRPGPETLAIKTFTRSAAWEGKMKAGALGLGEGELPTKGHLTAKWVVNDLWLVCEIEDQMGTGPNARTWKALWVSGWDFGLQEYRGTIFDSFGNSSMMRGKRDGHILQFESLSDVYMHGQATRLRFTFDASDAPGIKFTAEHTVNGTFVIDEQETHIPTGM